MHFHAGSQSPSRRRSSSSAAEWTHEVDYVFLVGAARSGTTWLQSMLASHPEIYTGPETHFFSTYHPVELEFWRAKDRSLGISRYQNRESFYRLMASNFREVISSLPEPQGPKRYFLEKSPHHCLSAEFILSTFPDAKFIHLVRDPRAVVASLLRASKGWGESWAPDHPQEAAQQWIERVEASRRCEELVASSNHFIEARYEDLRAEPHAQLARLFQFLGLPCDEALVRGIIDANTLDKVRGVKTCFEAIINPAAAVGETGQPLIYPEGFVGPAPVDGRNAELDEAAMRHVESVGRSLMREYGYELQYGGDAEIPSPEQSVRFSASIVLVTDGDDPEPALRTLSSMAPKWRDDWELLIVAHGGNAGNRLAECLEGDVQLLPCSPKMSYAGVLGHAAAHARGEQLLLAKSDELLAVDRRRLSALVEAPETDRRQTIQWLTQDAQSVLSLS